MSDFFIFALCAVYVVLVAGLGFVSTFLMSFFKAKIFKSYDRTEFWLEVSIQVMIQSYIFGRFLVDSMHFFHEEHGMGAAFAMTCAMYAILLMVLIALRFVTALSLSQNPDNMPGVYGIVDMFVKIQLWTA
jgi:hypothetical protein